MSDYKTYDLMDVWRKLPAIPVTHQFKNIPLSVLHDLGWRVLDNEIPGMGSGFFIPYFDPYKKTIPFAQTRHLVGDRRFTFLPSAKQQVYGKWNLIGNSRLFVVEGTSDGATLDYAGIPWLAMPSASSATILKELATFCKAHGIELIYAGDNDAAGDKLREALDEVMSYRVCQPPKEYKDWGEFSEATDIETVTLYCRPTLFEGIAKPLTGVTTSS